MNTVLRSYLAVLLLVLGAANLFSQSMEKEPAVGYVYPAGGCRGGTVQIRIGGDNLKNVSRVYITGAGVSASVKQYIPPLNKLQREKLKQKFEAIRKNLSAGMNVENNITAKESLKEPVSSGRPEKAAELPDHPMLRNLEQMSARNLKKVANFFLDARGRAQAKPAIQEMVIIEVKIAADAKPGDREIRLMTPAGLSNPLCFQVGSVTEITELNPVVAGAPATAADLPVLFNGQIMPGDIDRFRFKARKDQSLVIEAQARHLMPYMSDAVPGWLQPLITLYDSKGRELAYADHYRFNQDPVILFKVPQDDEYQIEIRDSIYRGREDFVYRLFVGEKPFITQMFPLGGKTGVATAVSVAGWNLPENHLQLNTESAANFIRQASLCHGKLCSNSVPYAVDNAPESNEIEPNGTIETAQPVTLSQVINGRIATPGDVDVFRFEGHAGFEFVAEVYARRLNSPLDSLLRLTDSSGRVLAWNDDNEDKGSGLNTHHADSYISFKLPKDGAYFLQISDAQGHGGEEYAYRLRVGPRRPDFELRVTPSCVNVPAGCSVPVSVHVLRRDGFNGSVELALKSSPGWAISGGMVLAGRDTVHMTLTAPNKPAVDPVVLQLEGSALIEGLDVRRPAVPAEDMMQAFGYRHLVPVKEFLAMVIEAKRRWPVFTLNSDLPVSLPQDGTAQINFKIPLYLKLFPAVQLELSEPPAGVSISNVTVKEETISFTLKADGKEIKAGYADNLIVNVFTDMMIKSKPAGGAKVNQHVSLGVLPAIPFKIIRK